jgi:hypothetical protein
MQIGYACCANRKGDGGGTSAGIGVCVDSCQPTTEGSGCSAGQSIACALPPFEQKAGQMLHIKTKALATVLFLGMAASGAMAQSDDGVFSALDGKWSGSGTMTMADGKSERVRCNVAYDVSNSASSVKQDLRCSSDNYQFNLTATVDSKSNGLSGYWSEKTRNVNGRIFGKATPQSVDARVEAAGFIATIGIKTNGDRQTVLIKSPSTDIKDINLTLRK